MRIIFFAVITLLSVCPALAQDTIGAKAVAQPDSFICVYPEYAMPAFPGGDAALREYLRTNVHYPDSALKYGRQGTVFVYFEVDSAGALSNFKVQRGVHGAPELDAEALRVVRAMPEWTPAPGAATVGMTLPIKFTLH